MYKLAHVFHAYNLYNLISAVLERRLIQHWAYCMQFSFLQGGPKSKPPNYQKNRIKSYKSLSMILDSSSNLSIDQA